MAKHEMMEIDSNYSWIGVEKEQTWWRITHRDELTGFVSRKSLNLIDNCDLPPPHKYLREQPCADVKIRTLFFDWEAKSSAFSNFNVQAKGSVESGLVHRNLGPSSNKGHLHFDCDKYSRGVIEQACEGDLSKAQLMEALCHSQTRAREAEEVAKQACVEKEHIIALFLIQASQLFAYKQLLQLLQLEVLTTQDKTKHQPISTLFPWIGRKLGNFGKPKSEITTYAIAFALGLSLVGAGLLLGWTTGRMLPPS